MKKYEPIPIPLKQRLRELRVRVLPVFVFLLSGVIVAMLWSDKVSSPGMIGKVIADASTVSSPANGTLSNFYYNSFDFVEEGQLLGQIHRTDSLLLNAKLDELRAEIDLITESLNLTAGEQRTRINLEELKIEEMNTRISLARADLNRHRALADFNRVAEMWERELVSDQEYEIAKAELELLNVQVTEYAELINYLSERIKDLEQFTGYDTRGDRDPILAAIKIQEQRMETLMAESAPIPVYASQSGVISSILGKTGEYVRTGDEIMKIESREPSYILGYVRQPFSVEPEKGITVEVRTRKAGRAFFNGQIEEIGGHITLIDQNMQRPGSMYESGLPVKISIAERGDIRLTPGEIVDIVILN